MERHMTNEDTSANMTDGKTNGNYLEIENLVKYFGDDRAVDGISIGQF